MACFKRIKLKKCNSHDNRDYYASLFIDGTTPNRFMIGKTIKIITDSSPTYDLMPNQTNWMRRNDKWIVKDVGTCDFKRYPMPYPQRGVAVTTQDCYGGNILMARKGRGLSDRRMSRYKRLRG